MGTFAIGHLAAILLSALTIVLADDACTVPGVPDAEMVPESELKLIQVMRSDILTRSSEHMVDSETGSGDGHRDRVPSQAKKVKAVADEGQVQQRKAVTIHISDSTTSERHAMEMQGLKVPLQKIRSLEADTGSCLNFLHIPKNAGSSIEELMVTQNQSIHPAIAVLQNGFVSWGVHDKMLECTHGGRNVLGCQISDDSGRVGHCSVWHIPPVFDSVVAAGYAGCETFCIVRSPLTKAISQHIYTGGQCTAEAFAANVRNKTADLQLNPFLEDCHWVSQSTFTGNYEGEQSPSGHPRRPHCQRVLRYENLQADFNELMADFELPLSIAAHHALPGKCDLGKRIDEIDPEVVQWIEDTYANDFKEFGYQRRTAPAEEASWAW